MPLFTKRWDDPFPRRWLRLLITRYRPRGLPNHKSLERLDPNLGLQQRASCRRLRKAGLKIFLGRLPRCLPARNESQSAASQAGRAHKAGENESHSLLLAMHGESRCHRSLLKEAD